MRLAAYRAARPRNLEIHGPEVVDGLTGFYQAMVDLFEGGNLGGAVVTATKPGQGGLRPAIYHAAP